MASPAVNVGLVKLTTSAVAVPVGSWVKIADANPGRISIAFGNGVANIAYVWPGNPGNNNTGLQVSNPGEPLLITQDSYPALPQAEWWGRGSAALVFVSVLETSLISDKVP